MTNWFIDEGYNFGDVGSSTRRETTRAEYTIQEEKIGPIDSPEYTVLRVEDRRTGELVAAATYEGDGSGINLAKDDYGLLEEIDDEFKHPNPLRFLSGPDNVPGTDNAQELDYLF